MKGFFNSVGGRLYSRLIIGFIIAASMSLAGCSSSSDDGNSIPVIAPVDVAASVSGDIITLQFDRSDGIGPEGNKVEPTYQYAISTSVDGEKHIFEQQVPNEGNPIRFSIAKTGADTSGISWTVVPYDLVEGQQYYIFVRAIYAGYGTSEWTWAASGIEAAPQPVENPKVELGDRRIVVSWTPKFGEQYGVNIDDCPKRINQLTPGFWDLKNIVSGDNIVFTVEDNTGTHKLCMASTNSKGAGEWYIFGTVDMEKGTITYDEFTAQAATEAPAAPSGLIVTNEFNGGLEVAFNTSLTGPASVSDYQYAYRAAGSDWSAWSSVNIPYMTDRALGTVSFSIISLENDRTYDIKIRAVNSAAPDGVESSETVSGTPKYVAVNVNDPDFILGKANAEFIYAEDVPHSDFWRISETFKQGGRPSTDRLVRGKETALGNLFADAVQWFATEKGYNPSFSFLVGDMINSGISSNAIITPRLLNGITSSDYQDDTIVIASVPGSLLIDPLDYDLDLNVYPAVGIENGYASTIFGQAASVYRNGHYGGSGRGGTTYHGAFWGMPSKEVRYTIEYLPYSLDLFNENFNGKPECVAARDANDGAYDTKNDPYGCYLMPYDEANPESGSPTESSVMGYKRGKIKSGSLTINGEPIDSNKIYNVVTTKKIADSMYVAFLKANYVDTGVTLVQAVAEYIYNTKYSVGIDPYLDGRVKLEGGVPGDYSNDFKEN